jgi:hypothetical protein
VAQKLICVKIETAKRNVKETTFIYTGL